MNRPKLLAARTPADGLQAAHVACTRKVQQEDKAAAVVTITTDCLILTKVTAKTRFCLGMAPSRRLKHLVCFYCNGRSAQKQDGTVRQWDCKGCDATNYLDEHGETTDPPTSATDSTMNASFAQAIEPPEWSTASTADQAFCQTCVKNQHLYRSSLAQYLPSEGHPEYEKLLDNLENFKAELDYLYPQVCENCVERVQSKMKRALYGAKADAHGRLLERTRRNGGPGARPRTWLEFFQGVGGTAWAWGIYLQTACLIVLLIHGITQNAASSVEDDISLSSEADSWLSQLIQSLVELATSFLFSIPETFMTAIPAATQASLALSIGSIWWNPQWRFTRKQNLNTVFGLRDWYGQQSILLSLRLAAWYGRDSAFFNDARAPITLALHAFILIFTIWTSVYSTKKVTMKPRKLFATAPDRETLLPKRKNSANVGKPRQPNTLLDALESLDDEPALPSSPVTPTTTINYASPETVRRGDPSIFLSLEDSPTKPYSINSITRPTSKSLFGASSQSTGHVYTDPAGPDPDAMEWTPTASQHRAFNSGLSAQRSKQSFNEAPSCPERSVFWYKVPQAPMTPARKLRNPPAQPSLAAASVVMKENFFQRTAERQTGQMIGGETGGGRKGRREYHIAQPRFFPPGSSEDDTGLANLLGRSFHISDPEGSSTDEDPAKPRSRGARKTLAKAQSSGWRTCVGM